MGIRATRMKWFGSILLMDDERLVLRTVKTLYNNRDEGDILMDVPETKDWEELRELATDVKGWKQNVRKIKNAIYMQTTKAGNDKEEERKHAHDEHSC